MTRRLSVSALTGLRKPGALRLTSKACYTLRMKPLPLLHVLVINWNGREHLHECFESLLSNGYPNTRYVLLDNASTDDSAAFVRTQFGHDPRIEIVEFEKNLGWSGCNNAGMVRALDAGADYILLINNDTATAPNALEELIRAAENNKDIGALAPKMLLYNQPSLLNSLGIECSKIGAGWDRGLGRLDGPKWDQPSKVLGVCGGACLLRAEAIQKAGMLPSDYEIYLDDLELCLRIWNAGYEVWTCPSAVVRHKFSATMGQGARLRHKYYLNTRNRFRLISRAFPLANIPGLIPSLCLGEAKALGRAILDGETWRVGSHLRAWAAAFAYLPRAIRARRDNRRAGIARCRFWNMLRHDLLFFPGVPLPENGWYPQTDLTSTSVRPMADHASLPTTGGRLRLKHANCYPALGETKVDVHQDGRLVTTLSTHNYDEMTVDVSPGTLEFRSRHIFDADDTGESADYGGWIAVEHAEGL